MRFPGSVICTSLSAVLRAYKGTSWSDVAEAAFATSVRALERQHDDESRENHGPPLRAWREDSGGDGVAVHIRGA